MPRGPKGERRPADVVGLARRDIGRRQLDEKAIISAENSPFEGEVPARRYPVPAASHDVAWSARDANGRVAKAGIWQ
jgi:hypothetical protein